MPQTQPPEVGNVLPIADAEDETPIDADAQAAIQGFVNTTEFLPADIFRSLSLMRRCDRQYYNCANELDELARKYASASKSERLKMKKRMSTLINLAVRGRNETLMESTKLYNMIDEQYNRIQLEIDHFYEWPIMDSDEEEQAKLAAERARERAEERARQQALKTSMRTALKKEKTKPQQPVQPLPPGYPRLTNTELVRLRKKMKKNPQWEPSEKVMRRELIMLGKLQPDGQMWREDVAAAEAAGLQPTMPASRGPQADRERTHVLERISTPPPRQARDRKAIDVKRHAEKKEAEKHRKDKSRKQRKSEEMEIDDNEPRYCICNDVSHGDMVACDNDQCPYEWFHFECVGLTAPPRGKWLCPVCRGKQQAPKKRKR